MEKWVKVEFAFENVEWDEKKRRTTLGERCLDFADLEPVLKSGSGLQRPDDRRLYGEERRQGMAEVRVKILFFAFTVRVPFSARIFSLRNANKQETTAFRDAMGKGVQDDQDNEKE